MTRREMRRTWMVRWALVGLVVSYAMGAAAQQDFSKVQVTTTPLGSGLSMLQGAGGNLGVLVGEDGVLVIDDQYAPMTGKIRAAIAKLSAEPIGYVLNTHWHGDHTGGNENFGEAGSHLVSHANVRRRLTTDQYSTLLKRIADAAPMGALPNITFTDSLTFHYNEQEIVAFHVPHAHTDGDGVLHLPRANVIHAGDVIFYGLYPYIDTSAGGSIDGMIAGVKTIIEISDDQTQIIPGHGPLLNRDQVQEYLEMLESARSKVAAEMAKGGDLQAVHAANPCAEWDETLGQVWLTSDQFVQSIFASLTEAEAGHTD